MDVVIRDYLPSDWPAICRVHDRARPDELRGSFDARAFIPLAEDPEGETIKDCVMFVAQDGDEIVGFAGIDDPYLAWLYVDPAHYRRGIGRALLRHCLARLGEDAWTLACGNNAAAIGLYLNEGFAIESRFTGDNAGYEGPSARLALHPERRGWTKPRRSKGAARPEAQRVDLFDSTYGNFTDRVLDAIRKDTFGTDIGQNSWVTVDEYDRLLPWLNLTAQDHALEVASGAGGPALYLARTTGCQVTGIDANESGVATATQAAARAGQDERVRFRVVDATATLPFDGDSFDGLLCIDSMNHFPDRPGVFREWHRVLRRGRRALFTDPVVVSGPITNDELALRSSIGVFLFVPPGVNEGLIQDAGFRLLRQEDVSENAAQVAGRWQRARGARKADLVRIEGEERFEGLQRFFGAVHELTSERRLSRIAYLVEKP